MRATHSKDLMDSVGNTPLLRLRAASEATGCTILGKCEFMNPCGSVKDRAARGILEDILQRDLLAPGGTIVEGTAGNTGISLTLLGRSLGFRSTIVIPRTQSQEKKDTLRQCGARLVEVDAVPYKDPGNYVRQAERLAQELSTEPYGAVWANQFDNTANAEGHYGGTGPEIWAQTDGGVDGFICAVGSGGTLAGTARYLREQNPEVAIGLVDVPGAALYRHYTAGVLESEGSSIMEGIGQGRITANLEGLTVDHACQVEDQESVAMVYSLLEHEGLFLGGSSGVNVVGAMRLAETLGPGHTVVTILCDGGARYQSKLFNPAFLKEKGLSVPPWLEDAT